MGKLSKKIAWVKEKDTDYSLFLKLFMQELEEEGAIVQLIGEDQYKFYSSYEYTNPNKEYSTIRLEEKDDKVYFEMFNSDRVIGSKESCNSTIDGIFKIIENLLNDYEECGEFYHDYCLTCGAKVDFVGIEIKEGKICPDCFTKSKLKMISRETSVEKVNNRLIGLGYETILKKSKPQKEDDENPFSSLKSSLKKDLGHDTDFIATKSIAGFEYNDNRREWRLSKAMGIYKSDVMKYEDIIGYELLESGSSVVKKTGLGRAVVGGVAFGGVGAIVGSITGKSKQKEFCTSLVIKIIVRNHEQPDIYLKLITSKMATSSTGYKNMMGFAQMILSKLALICDENERDEGYSVEGGVEKVSAATVADELREYKKLWDEGIIEEEDFIAKKKELLGL